MHAVFWLLVICLVLTPDDDVGYISVVFLGFNMIQQLVFAFVFCYFVHRLIDVLKRIKQNGDFHINIPTRLLAARIVVPTALLIGFFFNVFFILDPIL
jgi:hypothetical protein